MFTQRPFIQALFIFIGSWIIIIAVLLILYFSLLRGVLMTWGATPDEINRQMVGDKLVKNPDMNATRAVEILAPHEEVWPWLVQMGYKKAGLYSFGGLDNGGIPSAKRIIPEYQNLKVGDLILPILKVADMEPNKSMLWVFQDGAGPWSNATWSWGLYRTKDGYTRLVSRLRQKYNLTSMQGIITWILTDPIEIFMMRTTLCGIKHRVENNKKMKQGKTKQNLIYK